MCYCFASAQALIKPVLMKPMGFVHFESDTQDRTPCHVAIPPDTVSRLDLATLVIIHTAIFVPACTLSNDPVNSERFRR